MAAQLTAHVPSLADRERLTRLLQTYSPARTAEALPNSAAAQPEETAIQRSVATRLTIGRRASGSASAMGNITSPPFRTPRRRGRGAAPR
jgi:hypothetical protein